MGNELYPGPGNMVENVDMNGPMVGQSMVGMPSVMAQEAIAEQLKYLLENENMVDKVEHYLKGEVFDYAEQKYVKKYEAKCNKEGINQIMSRLQPLTDKSVMLTHIQERNANAIILTFAENFAIDLVFHSDEWGIKQSDIICLHDIITDLIYFSICRGEDGIEKRFLARTMFMGFQESNGNMMQGGNAGYPKQGFFEKINPFNRGRGY